MIRSEGKFTGSGGYPLHYQYWQLSTDSPRAVLIVAHGLAEHSGRYMNLVDHFVPRGYEVWGFDYEGHGRSGGRRGYVPRFEHYVADLETFLHLVAGKRPQSRLFLIGHSMGAPVAVLTALRTQQMLAGLVLSAGVFKNSHKTPAYLKLMAKVLSVLLPKMGVTKIDASTICRDEEVVKDYDTDPLVYRGKVSARLANELLKAEEQVSEQAHLLTLPMLLIHGGADRLCLPQSSRILYQQLDSRDKTLKVYDGLYHEVFNETEREQVLKDVEQWVEGRIIK
jgi:acylglycerol lipase